MKKLLIAILILLIILLGAAWTYLFLHGAPKSVGEVTTNLFGGGARKAPQVVPTRQGTAGTSADTTNTPRTVAVTALLTKVTDRPVAGAVLLNSSTTGALIRYVEKGTGNIYEVSLTSGAETRISNQTIPHVVEAIWSPQGTRVVLITDIDGTRGETLIGTLSIATGGTLALTTETLAKTPIQNIAFSLAGTLFYTDITTTGNLVAKAQNLRSNTVTPLFTTPFAEARVLWDMWKEKAHYIYTRPAEGMMGYLYSMESGYAKPFDQALQLTALRTDADTLAINKNANGEPYSLVMTLELGKGVFSNIETLPEKCAGMNTTLWCGASESENTTEFPIHWYQGKVSYADKLWRMDRTSAQATMVTDPEAVARESIDVTDMMANSGHIIFKNKKDDSLWLYNPPSS